MIPLTMFNNVVRYVSKPGYKCTSTFLCTVVPRNTVKFYSTQNATFQKPKTKSIPLTGYLMLSIPVATFCLGTWQVQRRKWKLNLIQSLNEKLREDPVALPLDLEELKDLDYRRVILKGTFDHDREQYIRPRTCRQMKDDSSRGLISSDKKNGTHVVTPFKLADRDMTVLVNRGWVPTIQTLPQTRPEGQVTGEVEIVGIYRKPERRAPFMPKNKADAKFWYWRDVEAMAEKLNVQPLFFDVVATSSVPGGPIGGQTNVSLRNEHFSYIITWYSLSAITSYLWYRRYIKRLALM